MKTQQEDDHKLAAEDSPTAWFCVLEAARNKADAELERRAERELRRLGVKVSFCRKGARHGE